MLALACVSDENVYVLPLGVYGFIFLSMTYTDTMLPHQLMEVLLLRYVYNDHQLVWCTAGYYTL